jgi:hypothetical protein
MSLTEPSISKYNARFRPSKCQDGLLIALKAGDGLSFLITYCGLIEIFTFNTSDQEIRPLHLLNAGKERSMHVCVAQAPAGKVNNRIEGCVCRLKLKSLCDMAYMAVK